MLHKEISYIKRVSSVAPCYLLDVDRRYRYVDGVNVGPNGSIGALSNSMPKLVVM